MPGGLSENPAPRSRRTGVRGEHTHRQRGCIGEAGAGLLPCRGEGGGRPPPGLSSRKPSEGVHRSGAWTDAADAHRGPQGDGAGPPHQPLQERTVQRPDGPAEQGDPSAGRHHRGRFPGGDEKTGPPGGNRAMKGRSLWKYTPPSGPVSSLLLIGLVLLSSLLYYRSVKIQRFLEPALALSQPRNEFAKHIRQIIQKEFGAGKIEGLNVKTSSIVMATSLLFSPDGRLKDSAQTDLQKLARVFLALMKDEHLRSEISIVLIIGHFP